MKESLEKNEFFDESWPDFIRIFEEPHIKDNSARITSMARELDISIEEAVNLFNYSMDLGINIYDLRDKKVLDVGSGDGRFKELISKLVGENGVLKFDRFIIPGETVDVLGIADKLPFRDGIFEYILAHASVPIMQIAEQSHGQILGAIKEMIRVVSEGGIIKIYPVEIRRSEVSGDKYDPFLLARSKQLHQSLVDGLGKIHKESPNIKFKIIRINTGPNKFAGRLEIYK
jgi:SAM-dependent methyltransferase